MSVPGVAVSKVEPAIDVRSITILGATGSIGASTVDLIKREHAYRRVEAIPLPAPILDYGLGLDRQPQTRSEGIRYAFSESFNPAPEHEVRYFQLFYEA